jgi:hypothetical protein
MGYDFVMGRARTFLSAFAILSPAVRGDWVAISLTPAGAWDTEVLAVTATAQFGSARLGIAPDAPQAMIWHGSRTAYASLGVSPSTGTWINGASDQVQVGARSSRACLWHGTPESIVDLSPVGAAYSYGFGAYGNQQVGEVFLGSSDNPSHGAMWTGTAASFVDMHPPGATWSQVAAAWGGQQGGYASFSGSFSPTRAGIWSGTAPSFVSIDPGAPYRGSYILGMGPGEQVGVAIAASTFDHACLWHGTAQSFVDLDPGWGLSEAAATLGGVQVGRAAVNSSTLRHACVWFGSAASFHDLSQHLPAGFPDSYATSIATDGFFYYVGGWASPCEACTHYAFLWIGSVPGACYPNCDGSTAPPVLNVQDFTCFLQHFAAGQPYANCDRSTQAPTLNVADFTCFLQRFAAGCP